MIDSRQNRLNGFHSVRKYVNEILQEEAFEVDLEGPSMVCLKTGMDINFDDLPAIIKGIWLLKENQIDYHAWMSKFTEITEYCFPKYFVSQYGWYRYMLVAMLVIAVAMMFTPGDPILFLGACSILAIFTAGYIFLIFYTAFFYTRECLNTRYLYVWQMEYSKYLQMCKMAGNTAIGIANTESVYSALLFLATKFGRNPRDIKGAYWETQLELWKNFEEKYAVAEYTRDDFEARKTLVLKTIKENLVINP